MKLFKSRKTYYLYNPNTLSYERVYPSAKDRFFGVLRHLSIGIVIGVGIFFIFSRTFDSPVESLLKKENKLLQTQYEVLSLRLTNALEVLDDMQQRDENLYRAIFQAESIPESVRKSGFGGTNRYEHLMSLSNPELVVSTTRKMDMLSKQLYVQSNSLEELITLGKNQEERSKCIPAIQPIANKDLKRTASGYGVRIDPIYRTPRFHSGMDFSAKVGTEIYATGDGVVTFAAWKQGYGNCLMIDHGHGFQIPYVFKKLFSHEEITFEDMCETKSVTSAIYIDRSPDEAAAYINNPDMAIQSEDNLVLDNGHTLQFIGKVGLFTPIKSGCGGGSLVRQNTDKNGNVKYDSVVGTKDYLWMESEMVKILGKEDCIDRRYYDALVDAAATDISKYGDFEWFVSEDPYVSDTPPWFSPGEPHEEDSTPFDVR